MIDAMLSFLLQFCVVVVLESSLEFCHFRVFIAVCIKRVCFSYQSFSFYSELFLKIFLGVCEFNSYLVFVDKTVLKFILH